MNGQWNGTLHPMIVTWNFDFTVLWDDYLIYERARGYVGMWGCHIGRTVGIACGTVLSTNQFISYGPPFNTTIGAQTEVDACALGGDSGGPWAGYNYAYGMVSASNQTPGATSCSGITRMWAEEILDAEALLLGVRTITQATGPI